MTFAPYLGNLQPFPLGEFQHRLDLRIDTERLPFVVLGRFSGVQDNSEPVPATLSGGGVRSMCDAMTVGVGGAFFLRLRVAVAIEVGGGSSTYSNAAALLGIQAKDPPWPSAWNPQMPVPLEFLLLPTDPLPLIVWILANPSRDR